jgi:DNA-binding transcriptional MerR regulator
MMVRMNDDGLLSIGRFSFRTGLSITALRHYDEIGLLPPASVDPSTGYRRYQPEQIRAARLICGMRTIDLPIDEVREVIEADDATIQLVLEKHRARLLERARALRRMTATIDEYLEKGVPMPESTTAARPVQITIHADDVPKAVEFYSAILDAEYDEAITSFVFGTYDTDSFFLLTIEPQCDEHPGYPGRGTCFTLWVDDLEATHQRALEGGATEVHPPMDFEWKPRTSIVDDPSGNRIALTQR